MTNKSKVVIAWMVIIVVVIGVLESLALSVIYGKGMTVVNAHLIAWGVPLIMTIAALSLKWAITTIGND